MLNRIDILCLIVLISFIQCFVTTKIHNFLTDWLERKKELTPRDVKGKICQLKLCPEPFSVQNKMRWLLFISEVPEFARCDPDMLQKEQP